METSALEAIEQKTKTNLFEKRYVYNGEFPNQMTDFTPLRNKPTKRRRQSPFNIIIVVFFVSILIVFYIWNKITVNRLVVEVNKLEDQYQKITIANDLLKVEISKKSALERIEKIAIENLKLTYPKEQPIWFNMDKETSP